LRVHWNTRGGTRAEVHWAKEVAQKVGRSEATIVRWMDTGKVKVTKKKTAQNRYIFTEADLQKFKSYNEGIR